MIILGVGVYVSLIVSYKLMEIANETNIKFGTWNYSKKKNLATKLVAILIYNLIQYFFY